METKKIQIELPIEIWSKYWKLKMETGRSLKDLVEGAVTAHALLNFPKVDESDRGYEPYTGILLEQDLPEKSGVTVSGPEMREGEEELFGRLQKGTYGQKRGKKGRK